MLRVPENFVPPDDNKSKLKEGKVDLEKDLDTGKKEGKDYLEKEQDACEKSPSDRISFNKVMTFEVVKPSETKAWISSMDTLPNGNVVMADFNNSKLYIYSQNLEKQKAVSLSGKPCCVVVLDNEKVAVTLQEKSSVTIINILSRKTVRYIKTPDSCHGITGCEDKLVVNCLESGLHFMDMCGKIETTVPEVTGEASLCSCENSQIYCSVYWSHKVLCYNNSGENIFSFSHLTMKCPRGITALPSGHALTTEFAKNKIHCINTEGTKSAVVLSKKRGINNPLCVLFNKYDDSLYVSNNDGESVTIYKLV